MNDSFSDEDAIPDESTPEGFKNMNTNFEIEEAQLTSRVMTTEFNNSMGESIYRINNLPRQRTNQSKHSELFENSEGNFVIKIPAT